MENENLTPTNTLSFESVIAAIYKPECKGVAVNEYPSYGIQKIDTGNDEKPVEGKKVYY